VLKLVDQEEYETAQRSERKAKCKCEMQSANFHFSIFIFQFALLVVAVLAQILVFRPSAYAAELPAVEVGLPEDGLFGLGGQYILDKGLDKRTALYEAALGGRAGDSAAARHQGDFHWIDDAGGRTPCQP
jgi:hypothetical protein